MTVLARRAAPFAILALGIGLAGCSYAVDWGEVEGVAFSEFDQSGASPTKISLNGSDTVIITEADAFSLALEGDSDAQEALRFDRFDNALTISRDQNIYNGNAKAVIRISMPAPSALSVSGAARMESEVMADDAQIDLSGSSSLTVANLNASALDLDMSGATTLTATGSVERMTIDLSGSSAARLGELVANEVQIDMSGATNVTLASNGAVGGDMSGASKLTVTGSATCSVSSSGVANITCANAETAQN